MNRFLQVIVIIVLMSCTEDKKQSEEVFFAGEIVNPTDHQVVLYKGSQKIDSAQLDEKNRFSFSLPTIENGLYHFNHPPEQQYVYLEKGDSLLIRLNTMFFDESLVFSGTNEILNNFLVELFLAEEEENNEMYSNYYELEPDDFLTTVDGLKNDKLKKLIQLQTDNEISDEGFTMLKNSINYTYNRFKEIYPFQHKRKTTEDNFHNLPKSFYNYRKTVNYNNENLVYLRTYYNFLKSHIGNLAYSECKEGCSNQDKQGSEQLHFYEHELALIDQRIENKELRDNLFRNVALDYLLKIRDTPKNTEIFFNDFKAIAKNNMHLHEIENLYHGIINLQPNKIIPNLTVVDIHNKEKTLQEIGANKKVIFYFWNGNYRKQYTNVFKRVLELKNKKPNYTLVGINMNTPYEDWVGIVSSSKLDKSTQYHSTNFKELTESLVVYPLNKSIITSNNVIVDGFSNIYYND